MKFVVSLLTVIFFCLIILNTDKFYQWTESFVVSSNFVHMWILDSAIIDIELIEVDDKGTERWIIHYVVQAWDTLWKIAQMFWVTVSHIQKVNNLKSGVSIKPNQKLILTDEEKWILYTVKNKSNVVVFANQFSLNVKDLMTLNYIQDETEILYPGQEIFINVDMEESYKLWLNDRPKPKIIPKVAKTSYTPVINKPSIVATSRPTTSSVSSNSSITPTISRTSDPNKRRGKVIRKWFFNKPIKNRFAAWHCTWGMAVDTPTLFPYIDELNQDRKFGWNGNQRYTNAKNAWFAVGQTPRVGAIIVYRYGSSYRSAGHVAKVVQLFPDEWKMIAKDMNRVWKYRFSEFREDIDHDNIIGYVYPPAEPWK